MNRPSIQILSPARDISVAKAAIQAGADAVYIGAPLFGARQAAANSLEDIEQLVRYAHRYHVEVLVTLNTLLQEEEYPAAVKMAEDLYKIGVDALIIQDLHLLSYPLPPIRLHASTQCDNRSSEQVIQLQQMGFKRAVLARELTIDEIRKIREDTIFAAGDNEPIELEVFVHGALCVSYSGRCYMSEVLTGRSANKGCCSQMCRMQYDLLDTNGQEIIDDQGKAVHQRYLLSLQDLDRSSQLRELIDAGVTTLKIEGRLKDADYVTNIVAYYRMLLSQLGIDNHKVYTRSFTPDPQKTFHRGSTDYFIHGRTANQASWNTPKSTGEPIGHVLRIDKKAIEVKTYEHIVLHQGDGLCFADQGFLINRIEGPLIYPNKMPLQLTEGTLLFRNLDIQFLKHLQVSCRLPVSVQLYPTNTGYLLQIGDAAKEFVFAHQPANDPQKAQATAITQLSKLGDTPYIVDTIQVELGGFFIPIGTLNQWRREVVNLLLNQVDHAPKANYPIPSTEMPSTFSTSQSPLMTCRYCILHEMGHCRRIRPMKIEPTAIRLRTGKILSLHFDCAQCEMTINQANS